MKKTNKPFTITKLVFILLFSIVSLTACSHPTNSPASIPVNPERTDSTDNTDTQDTPTTPTEAQPKILLIMPQDPNTSFATDTWEKIDFVSGTDLYKWQDDFVSSSDCEIEIMENGNENNINLEAVVYSDKVSVKSDEEGTVYFRIKNTNANLVTNYTAVTFLDNSSSESNTEVRFVGTWQTNYTQGLIDTIDFYYDGTGYCHNSRYPNSGGNTFRWSIRDYTTLNITNSLGHTGTCSYSFIGQSLTLTNFLGLPQNTAVTFTKVE